MKGKKTCNKCDCVCGARSLKCPSCGTEFIRKNSYSSMKDRHIFSLSKLVQLFKMKNKEREVLGSDPFVTRLPTFCEQYTESLSAHFLQNTFPEFEYTRNKNTLNNLSEGDKLMLDNAPKDSYDIIEQRKGFIELWEAKSSFSNSGDCSSFSPKNIAKNIIFARGEVENNVMTGNISFWWFTSDKMPDIIINKSKNQTFEDQQSQGRRPRFSVEQKIISKGMAECIGEINIYDIKKDWS